MPTRYTVRITKNAAKQLTKIKRANPAAGKKIEKRITDLSQEPRPSGVKKLKGSESDYRIRVGDYRVLYSIEDRVLRVRVFRVSSRQDAY